MTAGLLVSAHRAQGQHPWQGWVPCWWVGGVGSLARTLPRVNPPANRDSVPCWQGGVLPRVNPPTNRDPVPCWRVGLLPGACAQGSLLHPPTSREPTPARGVALVHGGQRPISLEYQINPPSTHI